MDEIERLKHNMRRIRAMVATYGGSNVLPGLDAMAEHLDAGDLAGAASIFETLLQKKGLLGDFYIPGEIEDADLLNRELSELLDETWALTQQDRSGTA